LTLPAAGIEAGGRNPEFILAGVLAAMDVQRTGFNGSYRTLILGPAVFLALLVLILASIIL
jgi:hypothetical protein